MQQEGNQVQAILMPAVPYVALWPEREVAEGAGVVMGRRAMYLLGTGSPGGLRSLEHAGTWPPFFPTVWERGSRKKGLATAGLVVSSGLGRR